MRKSPQKDRCDFVILCEVCTTISANHPTPHLFSRMPVHANMIRSASDAHSHETAEAPSIKAADCAGFLINVIAIQPWVWELVGSRNT